MAKKSNKAAKKATSSGSDASKLVKSGGNNGPAPVTSDPRFAKAHYDPRFRQAKRDATKIALDERFAHMMTSEEFSGKAKVDQYGRRQQKNAGQRELKRYYKLRDESETKQQEEEDASESASSEVEGAEEKTLAQQTSESEQSDSDLESSDEVAAPYDPMRGEGVSSSSESESEDEAQVSRRKGASDRSSLAAEDDEDADEDNEEVPLGDATRQIAVVNLDWDHIKAIDLFTIFSAFKPDGSVIKSVKIYPSEFGKQRMEQESREGPPKEIFGTATTSDGDESDSEANDSEPEQGDENEGQSTLDGPRFMQGDEDSEFDQEALRKYQLERLRYYFAVVECDAVATASSIYNQCDGAEVEATSNFFDLRFIPEGMQFDDEPVDAAMSAAENHRALDFSTQALQHSNVKLTWDDDDPDRVKMTRQKFDRNDLDSMDFKAYLATSSDESDEDDAAAKRSRYRTLLNEAEAEAEAEKPEGDMEITFTPGLSEAVAEMLDKKKERGTEAKDETTIEKYIRKQRERRQARKEARSGSTAAATEDAGISDDDVDVDMNDPYFRDALGMDEDLPKDVSTAPAEKKSRKGKKKGKTLTAAEQQEQDRERNELELLVMDSKDDREHFDMKKILKREKNSGKRRKQRGGRGEDGNVSDELQDDFSIDVRDPRFAALHDSHHFAIDPTNPRFKKTNAMKQLLNERQRLKHTHSEAPQPETSTSVDQNASKKDTGLAALVNSVKRKSGTNDKAKAKAGKRSRTGAS